ncbi:hypothetical protein EBQ74_00075 [bacterium]|nr:hypothetical protein [bacterium]
MFKSDINCAINNQFPWFWVYFLGIFFVGYLFTCKGYIQVSDTHYSVQTADAIVTRFEIDIPPSEGATLKGLNSNSYSKYGIGLPLYYVPYVGVARLLSWAAGIRVVELTGFLISFANIPFALLAIYLFIRCLRLLGVSESTTILMSVALGFGTLFWRYTGYDFSEMMQGSLLLLSVYGVLRRTEGAIILGGVGFSGLILVKLVHLALLPAFLGYILMLPEYSWRRRASKACIFLFPVVVALGFLGYLNLVRFGNPLETGYGDEAKNFFPAQLWWTIPSLLGSLDKGLFVFCPVLFLGLFGRRSFRRRYPLESALCSALVVGNLILAAAWHSWVGGWSWGPRLLVPAISLWLLPAAFWLDTRRRNQKLVAAAVIAISVIAQLPGVLVKDQEIHYIKKIMLGPEEQSTAPSDFTFAWILLYHKLTSLNHEEVYYTSEFGINSNRELDLKAYRSFRGLNLWTEHASRFFNLSALRWLPAFSIILVGFLAVKAWKSLYAQNRGASNSASSD